MMNGTLTIPCSDIQHNLMTLNRLTVYYTVSCDDFQHIVVFLIYFNKFLIKYLSYIIGIIFIVFNITFKIIVM